MQQMGSNVIFRTGSQSQGHQSLSVQSLDSLEKLNNNYGHSYILFM